MKDRKLSWLLNSWAYKKSQRLVSATIETPKQLLALVAKAQSKNIAQLNEHFTPIRQSISAAFRLLKAYASGEYRDISLESLALIVASTIYFVMPVDVIPDFIIALGYTDDAALLTWTLRSVADDIDRFCQWESSKYPELNNASSKEHNS